MREQFNNGPDPNNIPNPSVGGYVFPPTKKKSEPASEPDPEEGMVSELSVFWGEDNESNPEEGTGSPAAPKTPNRPISPNTGTKKLTPTAAAA